MPAEVDLFFCCLVYRCIVSGVSRGRFVFSVVWFTGRLLELPAEVDLFFCCLV